MVSCEFHGRGAQECTATPLNGVEIRCASGIGSATLKGFAKDQPFTVMLHLKTLEGFSATGPSDEERFEYFLSHAENTTRAIPPKEGEPAKCPPIPVIIPVEFIQRCEDAISINWVDAYR